MNIPEILEHGEQPLKAILAQHELTTQHIVDASPDHLTFKQVGKACKGRRLTGNLQSKILAAVNKASGKTYRRSDLFTYDGDAKPPRE